MENELPLFETIDDFSERVNLPPSLIRGYVNQGIIPHLRIGKRKVKICVPEALNFLRAYAGKTANEIAMQMPVPIITRKNPIVTLPEFERKTKYKGRIPDKVKARMQAEKGKTL